MVELGSDDGYFLQHFLELAMQVLGIEPAANVPQAMRAKGGFRRSATDGLRVRAQ